MKNRLWRTLCSAGLVLLLAACSEMPKTTLAAPPPADNVAVAIFAGGCFWCVEQDFEKLAGVIAVESGYTGGHFKEPNYRQVATGWSGHTEAVRVSYDPKRISYPALVEYFWRHIDPTARNRQFCDSGSAYRSAIFWQNETERAVAEASREALLKSGRFKEIHTEIVAASTFWLAEDEHQDYYKKNPIRYNYYRMACGRDAIVKQLWGDK